jgi:hypothetical protein
MNNIEQKFTSAGWSVQYRRDKICVVRGGSTLIVCYKYAGGGGYEEELKKAYETMIDKGYIVEDAPVSVTYSDNPMLNHLRHMSDAMKMVEDAVLDCGTRSSK